MRTLKRNRYYCDYCKKSGGGASAMKLHEKHCTNNPNRDCRMCKRESAAIGRLSGLNILTLEELRAITRGCPACMLAIFRQSHILAFEFNFKEEAEQWFHERDEQDRREDELATYQ